MAHDCRLNHLEIFTNEDGYLYAKATCWLPFGTPHVFQVEYCPVCGEKSKKSHIDHLTMYDRETGERIEK